jgi:hypothetical protein
MCRVDRPSACPAPAAVPSRIKAWTMVASRLSSTIGSALPFGERCLVIPLKECPDSEQYREPTRDACPYPDISRERSEEGGPE